MTHLSADISENQNMNLYIDTILLLLLLHLASWCVKSPGPLRTKFSMLCQPGELRHIFNTICRLYICEYLYGLRIICLFLGVRFLCLLCFLLRYLKVFKVLYFLILL